MMTGSSRRRGRLTPLTDALSGYLEESGLEGKLRRLSAVDEWPRTVGPRIATVTRAVEVRGDALVVEVASSAWLNELSMIRNELLDRINETSDSPLVERILFRLAERADFDRPTTAETGAKRPSSPAAPTNQSSPNKQA